MHTFQPLQNHTSQQLAKGRFESVECLQVDAEVGAPRVNYRETITKRANFDYLHKKQSGGQGQYGRVVGYIEPLPEDSTDKFEYANEIVGNAIPPNYLPSCKKGFEEAINSGALLHEPALGSGVYCMPHVDGSYMFSLFIVLSYAIAVQHSGPSLTKSSNCPPVVSLHAHKQVPTKVAS